jgi:peptidoglycan/LPS O-acetylase OafA/YrhL
MRGIAAIAVIGYHTSDNYIRIPNAYQAVDFFFVLSGFVIAHAYEQRLRGGMTVRRFMLHRLIRFLPLYLLALAIGFIVTPHNDLPHPALALCLALNMLFLPVLRPGLSPDHAQIFPFVVPAWSLFFELVANAVYALIAPRLGGRVLAAILVVAAAAMVTVWLGVGALVGGAEIADFWIGFVRVSWSFFAGVMIFRLPRAPVSLAGWVLLACLAVMLYVHWELAWALLGFPLLIYFGAQAKDWLASGCSKLGAASYGAYVLHLPLMIATASWSRSPVRAMVVGLGVVALAGILNEAYDIPMRHFLERELGKSAA